MSTTSLCIGVSAVLERLTFLSFPFGFSSLRGFGFGFGVLARLLKLRSLNGDFSIAF